ncbi:hypothetical protein QQF64_008291 [Cirrhinus molitorella]|uniref:Uncharacterized protein n=1 Tax=Cirrhinus molitorella TaxID=172907 RepID=A0ABR3M5Q8_9TELE
MSTSEQLFWRQMFPSSSSSVAVRTPEPVTLPSAQSTFQDPSRSHTHIQTHTLTRGVTRGSDGAKNNPSCRHKRAGEHTAVCCRKSVCACVCGRALPLSPPSLSKRDRLRYDWS